MMQVAVMVVAADAAVSLSICTPLHSACCRCGRSSNKERVDDLVGSAPPP